MAVANLESVRSEPERFLLLMENCGILRLGVYDRKGGGVERIRCEEWEGCAPQKPDIVGMFQILGKRLVIWIARRKLAPILGIDGREYELDARFHSEVTTREGGRLFRRRGRREFSLLRDGVVVETVRYPIPRPFSNPLVPHEEDDPVEHDLLLRRMITW